MTALSDAFASSGLCPSCFSGTGGAQTCPVCGYTPAGESDWNRLCPGTVLRERYAVGGALGQGGFGVTYLGLDLLLHTRLAIKEYYPSGICARNPENRSVRFASRDLEEDFKKGMEKFLEEARTLARFEDHPNIVSVKDFFEENGTAYMVMNYVEGKTLGEHLKERGGRVPFDEAMGILSPLMDALDEIHASGTIHRDLSPDNIYLTRYGQPKLLDFGASKSALSMMQQRSHSVILKRGYSPPEQYQSRGRLGPWTDVYGMAATLYRCVTGEVPADAMDRITQDILVPPNTHGGSIPLHAEKSILRALSLSSESRQQSMGEFKNTLGGSEPRTPPSIPTPRSSSTAVPRIESPSDPVLRRAQEGDAEAQVAMGIRYYQGEDVLKDDANAVEWFLKAAVQGHADAQHSLGWMYEYGLGVEKSGKIAVEWYGKAADQGHAGAQHSLGRMYQKGRGVAQDDKKAVDWYRKAADQGLAGAQHSLGRMYANGHGVAKNNKMAVELYRKAADQGHADAQHNLGRMYANGHGAEKNDRMAVEWYRKAADQGHADGQYDLGVMYEYGRGILKDYKKAVEWYRKAADQGHTDAQYDLGVMYEYGQGILKDYKKAVEWYRKAANQGHAWAQCNLGWMYQYGRGVAKDKNKAVEWYRKAAAQGETLAQDSLERLGAE